MHFKGAGAYYEAGRDCYPSTLVQFVNEIVERAAPRNILDLAAGTGRLSRSLQAGPWNLICLDRELQMLVEGRRHSLSNAEHVFWVAAESPHLPIHDHAIDLVLIGNALHWIDRSLPAERLAKKARDGCHLLIVTRSSFLSGPEPWKEQVRALLHSLTPDSLACYLNEVEPRLGAHETYLSDVFARTAERTFVNTAVFDPTSYADFLLSTSIARSAAKRLDKHDLIRRLNKLTRSGGKVRQLEETIAYKATLAVKT